MAQQALYYSSQSYVNRGLLNTNQSFKKKKVHGKMQFGHRYADDFRKNKYSKQDKKSCQKFPRHVDAPLCISGTLGVKNFVKSNSDFMHSCNFTRFFLYIQFLIELQIFYSLISAMITEFH